LLTLGIVRVTLDLLLPARNTGDREPLPWLPGLGDSPAGVYILPIYFSLAVTTIVIEVTQAFTGHGFCPYKSWKEAISIPYQ
jgi:hypothetical protein